MSREEALKHELDEFVKKEFEAQYNPARNIYMDFECFQDYNIGALLNMITTEKEYEYILSRLPNYEDAVYGGVTEHFPALGFTDDQIGDFIADPENHLKLSTSFMRQFFYVWMMLGINVVQRNSQGDAHTQPTVWINTHVVGFPERIKRKWTMWAVDTLNAGSVKFTNGFYKDMPDEFFTSMDIMVIDDFISFKELPTVTKAMVTDGHFVEKEIWALRQVDQYVLDNKIEITDELFEKTEVVYSPLVNLRFFRRELARGNDDG